MKNILVPTDFSEASHNAALFALALAHQFGAKLHLLNAVEPPLLMEDQILASIMITQAEIIQQNTDLIKDEMNALLKAYPVQINSYIREDFASEAIRNVASEINADLIVMGMKGKGKSNSIFGSTTTAVIRKLNYPVFVIPEKASFNPIENIILASDYDAETESEKYDTLLKLAKKFNSKIKILNVSANPDKMKPAEVIGKMKAGFTFADHTTEFHSIEGKNVIDGIEHFIEDNPQDILVMLAHGHSFFERLFGKIHTKEMSYKTRIPLLVLQDK